MGQVDTKPNIAPANTMAEMRAAIAAAATYIRSGVPIALPTETVYGLAADGLNETAVHKIFEIKGRPATNPLILHVSGVVMAKSLCEIWPAEADTLCQLFWPGPLTLVLKKAKQVPGAVTANASTVALRCPDHPIMRGVIQACQTPIAAPSANLSNQLSPTHATHVVEQLGACIPLVVDAGPCRFGIESTVLDLTSREPAILRPGHISKEDIERKTGWRLGHADATANSKSPGQLSRHYSPRAQLRLWNWETTRALEDRIEAAGFAPHRTAVISYDKVPIDGTFGETIIFPEDPEAYARALYHELYQIDQLGLEAVIVERPPEAPEWNAILDRLTRAQT